MLFPKDVLIKDFKIFYVIDTVIVKLKHKRTYFKLMKMRIFVA